MRAHPSPTYPIPLSIPTSFCGGSRGQEACQVNMSHKSIEIRYNRAIDGSDHMQTTSEPSASERIFTTAQVKRLGVPRNALAKACAAGRLLRVMHGAYRMAGVPSAETDELEAIWKLTAPSLFTHERVQPSAWDGIAAGGATAASIHGIGDFYLSPYVLIAPSECTPASQA